MNEIQPELEFDIEVPVVRVAGSIEGLVREIVDGLPLDDEISPYRIHVIVNLVLDVVNPAYQVRPQMMYNYAKNGLIVKGEKGNKKFTKANVIDFVTRFVTRNASK